MSKQLTAYDGAEAMHRRSLEISERLGLQELMANQYGNLGIVLRTRGDRDGARDHLRQAVALFERIGMPHRATDWREALASLHEEDATETPGPEEDGG